MYVNFHKLCIEGTEGRLRKNHNILSECTYEEDIEYYNCSHAYVCIFVYIRTYVCI